MFLFHSKNNPPERKNRKLKNINIITTELLIDAPDKNGNKSNNSTSKIKKIIATRKNRREKGARLSSLVENPHSKGLLASRSSKIFWEKISKADIRTADKVTLAKKNKLFLG